MSNITKLFPYFSIPLFLIVYLSPIITSLPTVNSQLDYDFYAKTCPRLPTIVKYGVRSVLKSEPRMAASLLRLHFHDCFVNGCEASVLLDDTKAFKGENNALPNRNSARGFEVIDSIKDDVERACPCTVSCADILALAAREAVVLSGGPYWSVPLGRSEKAANTSLPSPFEPLENITCIYILRLCTMFHIQEKAIRLQGSGKPDPSLDSSALSNLQTMCPNQDSSNSNLAPLHSSAYKFDNSYYTNIVASTALLESDQALMADPTAAKLVKSYGSNLSLFYADFAASMVKMGNLGVLTGKGGRLE